MDVYAKMSVRRPAAEAAGNMERQACLRRLGVMRMRAPYTQLFVHLVWATWDRLPLLVPDVERAVYATMRAKCDELRMAVRAMGGMPVTVQGVG